MLSNIWKTEKSESRGLIFFKMTIFLAKLQNALISNIINLDKNNLFQQAYVYRTRLETRY